MNAGTHFSLGKRLIGGILTANVFVLAINLPWFMWRGYKQHDLAIEGGREAFMDWLIHETLTDVIPLTLPLFVVNIAFAFWIVRQSLTPIETLSRRAACFDAAHLSERLSMEGVPDEIRPLIEAVNTGLDRIADGVDSQKRFTANAAHELRTPLAVLKARCSGADCSTAPKLSADIDRMAKIVDQLLAIAKLEMRQIPMDQPVDLNAMCQRVVGDLYPLALQRDCELSFSYDGAWRLAEGNAILLGDALRNLIENAIRFSPVGQPIEVELTAPGLVRVGDRGPGVAQGQREDIFRPFMRGGNSKGSGAGLGLSIALEVVELHGGRLGVSDNPGGGAVFTIDLSASAVRSGSGNVAAQ